MNEKEQTVADFLLTKISASLPEDCARYATAYSMLTQGAFNRILAENESLSDEDTEENAT